MFEFIKRLRSHSTPEVKTEEDIAREEEIKRKIAEYEKPWRGDCYGKTNEYLGSITMKGFGYEHYAHGAITGKSGKDKIINIWLNERVMSFDNDYSIRTKSIFQIKFSCDS